MFYNTDRSAQFLTTTLKTIVLYNTDRFPKLIYCASWLNGAPAKEVFGLCVKSANARVLCFTYFVVIHNRCGRLNQRETVENDETKASADQRAYVVP